jgi:hypothetical protein
MLPPSTCRCRRWAQWLRWRHRRFSQPCTTCILGAPPWCIKNTRGRAPPCIPCRRSLPRGTSRHLCPPSARTCWPRRGRPAPSPATRDAMGKLTRVAYDSEWKIWIQIFWWMVVGVLRHPPPPRSLMHPEVLPRWWQLWQVGEPLIGHTALGGAAASSVDPHSELVKGVYGERIWPSAAPESESTATVARIWKKLGWAKEEKNYARPLGRRV